MSQKSLDLVLVNPANRKQIYQSLSTNLSAIEPPVWAGLMATFVRNKGFSVQIVDACADELTADETAARVAELNPFLTAIVVYGHHPSGSTQVMPGAGSVCTAIKQQDPKQKVLLVGGHVAALPERSLREEDADFVAAGEGLYTMLELIEALKSGGTDLTKVRGLWYMDGDKVKVNRAAPLLMALEKEMPGIAWDLLPMEKYRAHNWHCFGDRDRQPYAALYTTLGCPFHCSYCCIQSPFKSGEEKLGYKKMINSYRFWSPQRVMEEIDLLVNKYGVKNLKISDEMFVLNPKHVLGICDGIIERGYDLNIWACARVDTIRDDMLDKLKRAGFNWMALGIENASQKVRDDVQKGYKQEEIHGTVNKIRNAGMYIISNYIIGLPEDDLETMEATLDLALDLKCDFISFYSGMAYPGSALYDKAVEEGLPLPESWTGYSQHGFDTMPLGTNYLSSAQVLEFRDKAFQVYYNNPGYLEMIARKFGQETVEQIRQMASHKLERKLLAKVSV
ncbi:B12-binding domain-containing radical SAM protein [Dapis sp. BLCC M126]|uniref:B12-binding domain-containing radical SAM protein n=1 Tax=Dapis sp. BLCC M126 TaxID=3400189 RepID=UPI003CEAC6F6